MIITRTPVRITLGGGGTDLPSYYSKHGGFLVSAAINRYTYICLHNRFEDESKFTYSKIEEVKSNEEIKHPIIREACKMLDIPTGIEIHSLATIPSGVGLGTSGSFTVGLLNALHTYKRDYVFLETLAEEACEIEINRMKQPIGKQDQYIAAFGGIICMNIKKNGKVNITPLKISINDIEELERNIILFYTGIRRSASDVIREQKEKQDRDDKEVMNIMHEEKEIGYLSKEYLENGELDKWGELIDRHWEIKKRMSKKISSEKIDRWYKIAKDTGAISSKICGAGGGGFFLFYCKGNKGKLRNAMEKEGLREMPFRFDFEGTKIIGQF